MNNRIGTTLLLGIALMPIIGCGGGGAPVNTSTLNGPTASSTDGRVTVNVPSNAGIKSSQVTIAAAAPAALPTFVTGLVAGSAYTFGPSGTNFTNPVTIAVKYDPAKIPAGGVESKLSLYTVSGSDWIPVANSTVDTVNKIVSAPVSHFSTYGVLCINPYAGTYNGTYRGGNSGTFVMVVSQSGKINVTGTDAQAGPFAGGGTETLSGVTAVVADGTGTVGNGGTFSFSGHTVTNGSTTTATGEWTSSGGSSGTWSIP